MPPLGSATTACTSDSAPLQTLCSVEWDVAVVKTRRTSLLFFVSLYQKLTGVETKRSESIPNDLRAETIPAFAESLAHHGKNCTVRSILSVEHLKRPEIAAEYLVSQSSVFAFIDPSAPIVTEYCPHLYVMP